MLSILFVARAWRILTGYGEADVSEVLIYGWLALTVLEQVGAMVKLAWCTKLARAKVEVIPELKEAVKEAAAESIPDYLKTLAAAPADYQSAVAVYPPGGVTPVDPTIPV